LSANVQRIYIYTTISKSSLFLLTALLFPNFTLPPLLLFKLGIHPLGPIIHPIDPPLQQARIVPLERLVPLDLEAQLEVDGEQLVVQALDLVVLQAEPVGLFLFLCFEARDGGLARGELRRDLVQGDVLGA
jgi:hypothetical protein